MRRTSLLLLSIGAAALLLQGCSSKSSANKPGPVTPTTAASSVKLTSSAFTEGGAIPADYTCSGAQTSPPLSWTGVPKKTVELVLVMEDVDAKPAVLLHWGVLGLDASRTDLQPDGVPQGARQVKNSFGKTGYTGPCPPAGSLHHYRFELFALSKPEAVKAGGSLGDLRAAIKDRTIAEGQLVGTFQKP